MIRSALPIMLLALLVAGETQARQFRQVTPIAVDPKVLQEKAGSAGDENLSVIEDFEPIDNQVIIDAITEILASWNRSELQDYLDQNFPQRFQLLLVLGRDIPADTELQLLSVQNINTTRQSWDESSDNQRTRISTVLATVSMQLRFTDPVKGLITLPHTSQFYLRVVETE